MMDFLSKLAGSKVVSSIGLLAVTLGGICSAMPGTVTEAFPANGVKVCAFIILAGGVITALGKGIADKRSGKTVETVEPVPGRIIVNRRGVL